MRTELELAFKTAAAATGRLSMILVRGRVGRATVVELATQFERAAAMLKRAAEKSGSR